jgi:hypothetical protein
MQQRSPAHLLQRQPSPGPQCLSKRLVQQPCQRMPQQLCPVDLQLPGAHNLPHCLLLALQHQEA